MSNKEKTIESLQFFVTELSSQALSHEIHARIFNSQGFTKLAKKYLVIIVNIFGRSEFYERLY